MNTSKTEQNINVPASVIKGKLKIIYDSYGVPHIYASNPVEMYFGQGYSAARDRLWQLEFYRHVSQGRVSELLGEKGEMVDEFIRKLGFRVVVQKIWKMTSPELKRYMGAYAGGVSFYLSNPVDGLPKEFKELNHKMEHWKPTDSVYIGRMMTFILGVMPMFDKLGYMMDLTRFTPSQLEDLKQGRETPEGITAKKFTGKAPKKKAGKSAKRDSIKDELANFAAGFYKELKAAVSLLTGPELIPASNNWVVAPKKSKSGAAIMANDPHLAYWHPSMVYETHLNCPGVNIVGATSAGYLDVIIGQNANIAWGLTTCQYDVMDVYMERLKPGDPEKYKTPNGDYKAFKKKTETIKIKTKKGMKSKTITVKSSVHGPIIWDNLAGNAVSLKWTGHEPSNEQLTFHLASRAKNVNEFRDALKHYKVGCMNFVYADVDGNIFWMTPANVPIRNRNGLMPMDGSSGKHEWTGYVPFDELPSLLNPEEGFIATANNRPVPVNYKHYLAERFDTGYRQRRISELLRSKKKLTFEDIRDIQNDNFQYFGKLMKDNIVKAATKDKKQLTALSKKALEYLKEWDCMTDVDSIGSTVFHYCVRAALHNVIDFNAPSAMGGGDDGAADVFSQLDAVDFQTGGAYSVFLSRLLNGEPMKYQWLAKKGFTLEKLVTSSLNEATALLKKLIGPNPSKWQWGRVHTLTLKHLAMDAYDHGEFPVDGSFATVRNTNYSLRGGERASVIGGTVMTMVCEMKKGETKAVNTIAGGQRYIHGDPHYDDQLKLFIEGKARPMLFDKKDVLSDAQMTINFTPKGYGWRKRRVKKKK